MIVASLDILAKLSKDELWEAALDKRNADDIQHVALQKWLVLDEREHRESMARMRLFLQQYKEYVNRKTMKRASI